MEGMDIKGYIIALVVMAVLAVITYVWNAKRASFKLMLTNMIQNLELAVTGSKMGAVRKKMLLDILAAAKIKVPGYASDMIDQIVAGLNKNKAWITEFCGNGLSGATTVRASEAGKLGR
jgi:hypothetical protein